MKKALAISMSLVLLFFSMSFTVATHYCGGRAVKSKLLLGNGDLSCGMVMKKSCDNHADQENLTKKACCENEYLSLNTEDYQPTQDIPTPDINFVVAFVHTFILNLSESEAPALAYADYSPPLLRQDKQVLFQSFLL